MIAAVINEAAETTDSPFGILCRHDVALSLFWKPDKHWFYPENAMSSKKPISLRPRKHLPKRVESVVIDGEGREMYVLIPFEVEIQWPGVAVNSGSFEKLSVPEKFYEQAFAFLRAAKVLCEAAGVAGESGKRVSWPQGSVCLYCLNLATELFLKACISRGSGEAAPPTHDLTKLLRRYEEVLPGSQFQFQVPILWRHAASDIENALGRKLFNPIDKTPDQLYRYAVDKGGAGSALMHMFVPDMVFSRITQFEKVWQRAWKEVHKPPFAKSPHAS